MISVALASQQADRLPLSTRAWVAMLVLSGFSAGTFVYVPMVMLSLGYFSLWFCWRIPAWRLPWRGDYSYGLFLYGFPVQQMMVTSFPNATPLLLTTLALPATLVVAMASWHWLEQPLLSLKQSRNPPPTPPRIHDPEIAD